MVSNKNRLYIALYPSGVVGNEERRYHWGFLIGPKAEKQTEVPGMRYHVKNHPTKGWIYEELPLSNVRSTSSLLARILIAKVEDKESLVSIFRTIPIVQKDPNWRCRTWVASALTEIAKDSKAVGTSELDWQKIEDTARNFVGEKTIAGRYQDYANMLLPKPTWDMLENREIVP